MSYILGEAMARYKRYAYAQTAMIPVSLEKQLMPGTLAFAIHVLVQRRGDRSSFDTRYNNAHTGCLAYAPQLLLKGVLLACSRGLISSRKIEQACQEHITF